MLTGNIPEKSTDNKQISMSIPMSTPIFKDMSPTNSGVEYKKKLTFKNMNEKNAQELLMKPHSELISH